MINSKGVLKNLRILKKIKKFVKKLIKEKYLLVVIIN